MVAHPEISEAERERRAITEVNFTAVFHIGEFTTAYSPDPDWKLKLLYCVKLFLQLFLREGGASNFLLTASLKVSAGQ
ncbi:hypothetical protein BTJ40_17620 [Microbulbifer sp. A4B17]|nr:hypothetical protein BTJ40_17620 [Microbulbifer sp. A4B17]